MSMFVLSPIPFLDNRKAPKFGALSFYFFVKVLGLGFWGFLVPKSL